MPGPIPRLLALLLACVALAGCAARAPQLSGPAASCPAAQPAFEPATVKQSILDGALAEWRRWGERVIYLEPERTLIEVRGGQPRNGPATAAHTRVRRICRLPPPSTTRL